MASNWIGAVELCSIGCTLIGPVDGDLRLGIRDNSLLPSSFNGSPEGPSWQQPQAHRCSSGEHPHGNPAKLAPAKQMAVLNWKISRASI